VGDFRESVGRIEAVQPKIILPRGRGGSEVKPEHGRRVLNAGCNDPPHRLGAFYRPSPVRFVPEGSLCFREPIAGPR